jgi:hypothetical protein
VQLRVGRHCDQSGFTTSTGLVATAVGLLLVSVLLLFGLDAFGGGNASTGTTSIISRSHAESQLKLCAEGHDSTYGSPPSATQQATCLNELAGEISSTAGTP